MKSAKTKYSLIVIALILLFISILFITRNFFIEGPIREFNSKITINDLNINATEVISNVNKPWQAPSLKSQYGDTPLLFVIPKDLKLSSWAANIRKAYNIYWIKDSKILDITENIVPSSSTILNIFYGSDEFYIKDHFGSESFYIKVPSKDIDFVLEIPLSSDLPKKIKIGDNFKLN